MHPSSGNAILYRKTVKQLNCEGFDDVLLAATGLKASDGAVVLSHKKSALFVDGRYSLAAKQCVDQERFEISNLKNEEIAQWIEKNLPNETLITYDPRHYTHESIDFFVNRLKNYNFNRIDLNVILNMPLKKFSLKLYHLNKETNRLSHVIDTINQHNLCGYLICDPCTIAWLLGIRDLNQRYTPIVQGYLLVTKNSEQFLYLNNQYITCDGFRSESELLKDISRFSTIGIDKSETPVYIKHKNFVSAKNPCTFHKSIKNEIEINDIKAVSQKDSIAIINFLYWFHNNTEKITESAAAEKLLHFRELQEGFVGESFRTISAADENAAVVHYFTAAKVIKNILLIDSGGQYKNGTTDITRTISKSEPNNEEKLFYTLVLKGHIALANARFFSRTSGSQLDSLARQFLRQYSRDYNHSTGHGIGYMSHVHEGAAAISKNNNVPLQAGMILSNEPGYYQENNFGIRLKNMMLVSNEKDGFLSFETISLVPFDHKFIYRDLLTGTELDWLARYNKKIIYSLSLQNEIRNWLIDYYLKDFL